MCSATLNDSSRDTALRLRALSRDFADCHLPYLGIENGPAIAGLNAAIQIQDLESAKAEAIRLGNLALGGYHKVARAYCAQIERNENHAKFVPTSVDDWITGDMISRAAFITGIIPPKHIDFHQAICVARNSPERRRHIRNVIEEFGKRADAGQIPTDDAATWYFAVEGLSGSLAVQGQQLLTYFKEILECKLDIERRVELAKRGLDRFRSSFSAYADFGRDVPIRIYEYEIYRPRSILLAAIFAGHDFEICYHKRAGLYEIICDSEAISFLQKHLKLNAFKDTWGNQVNVLDRQPTFLINRKDILSLLNVLRQCPDVHFRPVHNGSLQPLPFRDRWEEGQYFTYSPKLEECPLYVSDSFAGVNVRFEFDCVSGSTNRIYRPKVILSNKEIDLSMAYGLPPFKHGIQDSQFRAIKQETAKIKKADFVIFNNHRYTCIFDVPLVLPGDLIHGRESPLSHKKIKLYGFQSSFKKEECFWITDKPIIPQGAERFNRPPLEMTYGMLAHIKPKQVLNRFPLTFAFDPELKRRGFPSDAQGRNGLTDFRTVSIPLVKPRTEQAGDTLLVPIQGMYDVPSGQWLSMVRAIEGDYLDQLEFVQRMPPSQISRNLSEEEKPLEASLPPEGQYYKSPRDRISIVGRWIISHCSRADTAYFIVDSPLYGDALYLFRSYDGALRAAEHFARGGRRDEVRLYGDFVRKLVHDSTWETRLNQTIERDILS